MEGRFSPQPLLPPGTGVEPYELFSLFIPEDLYTTISKYTNLYASSHSAGEGRTWIPTILGDIKTFFAAIFYMGAWGALPIDSFWKPEEVVFKWLQDHISQTRFEQIKRFLHVSDPRVDAFEPADPEEEAVYEEAIVDKIWWHKVEPLVGRFRQACTRYYQPSNAISIDESMIRCFGRSSHTYKMPNMLEMRCRECTG